MKKFGKKAVEVVEWNRFFNKQDPAIVINVNEFDFTNATLSLIAQHTSSDLLIVDVKEIKETIQTIKKDWFGDNKYVLRSVDMFWQAFLLYIFPILSDIAKVYCAFMVVSSFFKEKKGTLGDGQTGFTALAHYGKWYLLFSLIPWGVELVDELGRYMYQSLMKKGVNFD